MDASDIRRTRLPALPLFVASCGLFPLVAGTVHLGSWPFVVPPALSSLLFVLVALAGVPSHWGTKREWWIYAAGVVFVGYGFVAIVQTLRP